MQLLEQFLERLLERFPPSKVEPQRTPEDEQFQAWRKRIEPLGPHRSQILFCLSGSSTWSKGYFDPPDDIPLVEAVENHFERLYVDLTTQYELPTPNISIALVAAGLAACGQREMIGLVLPHVPEKRVILDHGAGWCLLVPFKTVSALLPLPPHLKNYTEWIQGSPEVQAVQDWYEQHRQFLQWDADYVCYQLAQAD